jgi:hypothetical protein
MLGSKFCSGLLLPPEHCSALDQRYLRSQPQGTLSVGLRGTFAIFSDTDAMRVFAPNVVDDHQPANQLHRYYVGKPNAGKPDNTDPLFDIPAVASDGTLITDHTVAGITGTNQVPPTFQSDPRLPNNFDPSVNFVVPKTPHPVPGAYRHLITLPLPDDILLQNFVQSIPGKRIFMNQQITDFCYVFREHKLIYKTFDITKLAFDTQRITNLTEPYRIRILSEPISDINTTADCVNHVERAMQRLAEMLGRGAKSHDFDITYPDYCDTVPLFFSSATKGAIPHRADDGPGSGTTASRMPACMSVLVSNT